MLLILLGRSATGKTTVADLLIKENNFKNLVSYTTREARVGERDGIDYNFVNISDFQFLKMDASFSVNDNWKYGVALSEDVKDKNFIFPVISFYYAKELYDSAIKKNINVFFVTLNVEDNERKRRLINRGESEDSIEKRFDIESSEGKYPEDILKNLNGLFINADNKSPDKIVSEIINGVQNGIKSNMG